MMNLEEVLMADGMAPGQGGRFKKLKGELSKRKGVTDPGGLAAFIGRKKYGDKQMGKWSSQGRRKM